MIKIRQAGVRFYRPTVWLVSFMLAGWAINTFRQNNFVSNKYKLLFGFVLLILVLLVGILLTRRRLFLKISGLILLLLIGSGIFYALDVLRHSEHLVSSISAVNPSEAVKINPDMTFSVYISGIDTYGDIKTTSRSDVNVVATLNLTKRKMLLVTVPRDAYVPIALGGQNQKDKLTHAGIYGIESSVKTLENLLATDIPVYVKVNFSSFIDMIDVLGGVVLNNPQSFVSQDGKKYPSGDIKLDGARALSFSRERKSIGGDIERGKNQQRVIEAVFRKLVRPGSIANYRSIFAVLGKSIQTNLSVESINKIIAQQVDGGDWLIESISLTGRGQTGGLKSFAMPNHQLYMYVLDDNSVIQAQNLIKKIKNGD